MSLASRQLSVTQLRAEYEQHGYDCAMKGITAMSFDAWLMWKVNDAIRSTAQQVLDLHYGFKGAANETEFEEVVRQRFLESAQPKGGH